MIDKSKLSQKHKERLVLATAFVILSIGTYIEFFNLSFVAIEADSFNGLCTTIVGVQATVSVVIFSMVTMFSSFLNKERYGIPVIRYLIKYRNKVLNHSNIFYFVMILLVVSSISLFFGWINIIFCSFVVSTILITYLAKESFLLYRVEDIDEEMFSFLKDNLHNKDLNLFEEYLRSERMHLDNGDYKGKKPDSRLDELWMNEIQRYSSLPNDEFTYEHDSFVMLVKEYLENSDYSVQAYGLNVAFTIIKKYKSEGIDKDDSNIDFSFCSLALDSFIHWIDPFSDILYSNNCKRDMIRSIVTEISLIEDVLHEKEKYFRNPYVIQFFQNLICKARNSHSSMEDLYGFVNILIFYAIKNDQVNNKVTGHAIHFLMMVIENGYLEIIKKEVFDNIFFHKIGGKERFLYGLVICYLYYLSFDEQDVELRHSSAKRICSKDVFEFLKQNGEKIRAFFVENRISYDEIKEIADYISLHEKIFVYNHKRMSVDNSVLKCIIFFEKISSLELDECWLKELVERDWSSIYLLIVENNSSKNEFLNLDWLKESDDENYEKLYLELEKDVYNYTLPLLIKDKSAIASEDEEKLCDYLEKELGDYAMKNSFGHFIDGDGVEYSYKQVLSCESIKETNKWESILKVICEEINTKVCSAFENKLDAYEISDYSGALKCLNDASIFDYRIGNPNTPLYDNDFALAEKIKKTVPPEFNTFGVWGDPHVLVFANTKKISVSVSINEVVIREVSETDALNIGIKNNGKYQYLVGFNKYFSFEASDYLEYVKNNKRMLNVKYCITVNTEKGAGYCYYFIKPDRKLKQNT